MPQATTRDDLRSMPILDKPVISYDDIIAEMYGDELGPRDLVTVLGEREHAPKTGHTSGDGKVHAILGASSSDRWMKCPGSVRMSKGMPNRSSVYAMEGTVAHHLAEMSLAADVAPHWFIGQFLNVKGELSDDYPEESEDENMAFEITEEMADAVAVYTVEIERVTQELKALYPGEEVHTFLEKGFDLSRLYPDMFGTNDYSIFVKGEMLVVLDYKHGRGKVVEARDNPQLLYYALGAILEICRSHDDLPKIVRTIVVQPRAKHRDGYIRSWDYTLDEVTTFSRTLIEKAINTEDPDAPLVPGETQCFFCNGKARPCPAIFERAQELAMQDFTDLTEEEFTEVKGSKTLMTKAGTEFAKGMVEKTLSNREMMIAVLRIAPVLDAWIRDVQAYAQHEAENGVQIDDHKLVRKRSNRKLRDEKETIARLRSMGVPDKDIFKEPKVKTPAQLEKIKAIGKELVAELSYHPEGALTLVTNADARPAIDRNPFGDLEPDELNIIDAEFTVIGQGDPLALAAPLATEFDLDDDSAWDIV